ncbi:MAG: hypothetical protein BWY89_01511 [Bacteroidetes bacterium ADurb.BinA012]|nr:MAG: hypothetical protein BWY89_01511 [Bacteroidetes bacterium ADurb.BinA012]
MVYENGLHPGLGQITHKGAAGYASAGNQRCHLHLPYVTPGDYYLRGILRKEFTHGDLVRERGPGSGITYYLYACRFEKHREPFYAPLAAAGPHAKTRCMLDLIK